MIVRPSSTDIRSVWTGVLILAFSNDGVKGNVSEKLDKPVPIDSKLLRLLAATTFSTSIQITGQYLQVVCDFQ